MLRLKLHTEQKGKGQVKRGGFMELLKDNRGSAMLVAIVVSVVVIAFSLSMLMVSYALFASSVREGTKTQCKELTKSISQELEREITYPQFKDFGEQQTARSQGKYSLYFYLRDNLSNDKWPYYGGVDQPFHTASYAWRYFDLDISGGEFSKYARMADEVLVCMYWSPDGENNEEAAGGMLTIEVNCKKGDQACTIKTDYMIQVEDYTDPAGQGEQCFTFHFEERE